MAILLSAHELFTCSGVKKSGTDERMSGQPPPDSERACPLPLSVACDWSVESDCPLKTLLVDRNGVTRLGVRACLHLDARVRVVAEASRADAATRLFEKHQPQLVILDTCLPDRDGLDLAREFVRLQARVLIFSHQSSNEHVLRAYAAQVHGFVAKSCRPEALLQALAAVKDGHCWFPEGIENCQRDRTSQNTPSAREAASLQLVSRGLSNKEIAQHLGVSEATAKTFLARIMRKMGVHDRTQAVLVALERGWIDGRENGTN
jgi:two-component system NarL family response regulator